jgi:hypothetical protein
VLPPVVDGAAEAATVPVFMVLNNKDKIQM